MLRAIKQYTTSSLGGGGGGDEVEQYTRVRPPSLW